MVLLMHELENDYAGCFDNIAEQLVEAVLSPPASSVQLIRTWLLELFVRGAVPITPPQIKVLAEGLSSTLDKRQILLIRARVGDKGFFRKNKTAFNQLSSYEQPCLIWGASCLPKDEYNNWLATLKPLYSVPTGQLFLSWAKDNREALIAKLDHILDDHPE